MKNRSNHLSCVLRVEAGGHSMLLTSDIEATDEAAMLARYKGALASDVLLVPHHGSKTSSTKVFLQAVGAKAAVIPVGYRNRFGHPKPTVLARYEMAKIPILRTDQDGAVTVSLNENAIGFSKWREEHRRYWHGR